MGTPRPRILMLETLDDAATQRLAVGAELVHAASVGAADVTAAIGQGNVDAIVTRGKGQAGASLIARCPGLKVIARAGVGLDNVDIDAATRAGVTVLNLPGINAGTVAEHTLGLMLAIVRAIPTFAEAVQTDAWSRRTSYAADELAGKSVGIVGLGNVGRRVADLCAAFSMDVRYADPRATSDRYEQVGGDAIFASDVITLHCHLDDASRGLIGPAALARMPSGAVIVNTARGELIDQVALHTALESGQVAGLAADVLDWSDRSGAEALASHPRTVITPHIASLTKATYRAICGQTATNVIAFLAGEQLDPRVIVNAITSRG